MCLVLKLDNGKVVSIANEQTDRVTDRVTEPSTTVLVYRLADRQNGQNGQTDRITDRVTEPSSTVLVYRCVGFPQTLKLLIFK